MIVLWNLQNENSNSDLNRSSYIKYKDIYSPILFEGSKVINGEITSSSNVRVIRDGSIIFTGKISSLFREKNQVKQVNNGQECGITLKDYMDFQKNDTIEAFNITSKERNI